MRDRGLGWFLKAGTEAHPRQHVGLAVVRVLVGLMWLYNVAWKRPPGFGESTDSGLYGFTAYAVEYPVLPPFSWVVENVVLPNIAIFGWAVILLETALAVLLLTGTWVRPAAVLGIVQSAAIGFSVAFAPEEWPWSYWLMIGAHLALLVGPSGRGFALDAVRTGLGGRRLVGIAWGAVAVLLGLYSLLGSLSDPLADRGPGLGWSSWSVSFGFYNLLGALVLLVLGALLLAVATGAGPTSGLGLGAAALGGLAGLSLHAQIGFTDPLLGGTGTSAAVFFSLALVGGVLGRTPARVTRDDAAPSAPTTSPTPPSREHP